MPRSNCWIVMRICNVCVLSESALVNPGLNTPCACSDLEEIDCLKHYHPAKHEYSNTGLTLKPSLSYHDSSPFHPAPVFPHLSSIP